MPVAVFRRKIIKKKTGYLVSIPSPLIKALGSPPREVVWVLESDGSIKVKILT